MLNFKGMRFPIDVILICTRWYAAYPLSYRHLEEIMEERGVSVDHSSINRWAIRFLPLIEKMARKHKRLVGGSWRMDETYIKGRGVWKYLYRAVGFCRISQRLRAGQVNSDARIQDESTWSTSKVCVFRST
jgi:putative transposase